MCTETFSKTKREIIILDEFVKLKWFSARVPYYQNLGYEYTGYGDEFWCRVSDMPLQSNVLVTVLCPVCKEKREMLYSSIDRYGHTLCKNCAATIDITGRRYGSLVVVKLNTTENNYKNNGAHWICICDCGNKISVAAGSLQSGNTQSCGCHSIEVHRALLTGENNPRWNPGLAEQHRIDRRSDPKSIAWRKAVFARDNHTCMCCGKRGVTLHAHHLFSRFTYDRLKTDPDNGITLCVKHHRVFHKWMGGTQISCTAKDFLIWAMAAKDVTIDLTTRKRIELLYERERKNKISKGTRVP